MDLISRQAAIDRINKQREHLQPDIYPQDKVGDAAYRICAEFIERLPSVQPEIVRCGQCKYAEVADKEDAQDGYTCQFHRGSVWFSGSYCSWAERRQDEKDDQGQICSTCGD